LSLPVTEKLIRLYTDGACSGNPGPGGWAALLIWNGLDKMLSGFHPDTTNNRMELKAVIEGLKAIKHRKYDVLVTTDSTYVQLGITQWIHQWKKRNWKKVKNPDLWQELDELVSQFPNIRFEHVEAHAGHPENERCDKEARRQSLKGKAKSK